MTFSFVDWLVLAAYFVMLAVLGYRFSRQTITSTHDYFLGGRQLPVWAVSISVIAASYSAATFLGGPDQGYRADLSYIATVIGALMAAIFVATVFIPRFYHYRVATVYELLELRFGEHAKTQAGFMFLLGRVFASGARLYMAAIAVAMILFGDVAAIHIVLAIVVLSVIGVTYSIVGGIRSIIYTDTFQTAVYVSAALVVIYLLLSSIPASWEQIIDALQHPVDRQLSKLTVFDFRVDFGPTGVFTFWSAISGFFLLNTAAFGLDQDMTQQVLTCKNAGQAAKAMLLTVLLTLPVMTLFIVIGLLLHIFYQRPDLMQNTHNALLSSPFSGQKITVFMHYILTELPSGVRGLVTVGVIAAALSTLNSAYNSMSSVFVHDIYKPLMNRRQQQKSDRHYVWMGRVGMAVTAVVLAAMACLCFFWQQYSDMPLLQFALSVMVFAYSGLLGVYFTAVLTSRGSERSVLLALLTGFSVTLLLQPYVLSLLHLETIVPALGFTWQLCIGTVAAFTVAVCGQRHHQPTLRDHQNTELELT